MKINGNYADLWKAIIRPPKEYYDITDLGIFLIFKRLQDPRSLRLERDASRELILNCIILMGIYFNVHTSNQ